MIFVNSTEPKEALNWIDQKENWFFSTALFQPGRCATKWRSAQSYLRTAVHLEKILRECEDTTPVKDIKRCQKYGNDIDKNMDHARQFADQALAEVYKYIEIQPITVEKPSNP